MPLPIDLDKSSPADADNPSAGAASIRDLKDFLQSVFGISDAVNYTVAPFSITTAGVVTIAVAGAVIQAGTAAAPSLVFSGATTTGLFRDTTNTGIGFSIAGAQEAFLSATAFGPSTNDGAALGTTTLGWADLHLATGGVINWANGEITITETDANTLTIAGVATLLDIAAGILELNNALRFDTGVAIVAASYSVGRDADATNQLHFNIATGATFEWSVNDVAEMLLSATNLTPGVDDGNALGSATVSWSDLFLASGAVINFNNGDVTITHAANSLTLAGGDFTCNGNLLFTDNTYDIGASGATRPRNIYNSGILNVGTGGTPVGQVYIKSAAAGTIALVVDTAASPSGNMQEWRINGTAGALLTLLAADAAFEMSARDLGNDIYGPHVSTGRNSSAGAVGPAAGTMLFKQADNTNQFVWADAVGKLRINTTRPTGSSGAPTVSDTAGGVIGDQTSYWRRKTNITEWEDYEVALSAIVNAKLYSFQYAQSSYLTPDNRPQIFFGPVIWEEDLNGDGPWYGKNFGRQQEPSLNEITGLGYSFAAIKALHTEITRLKARVANLEAR